MASLTEKITGSLGTLFNLWQSDNGLTASQEDAVLKSGKELFDSVSVDEIDAAVKFKGAGYEPVYQGINGTDLSSTFSNGATSITLNGYDKPISLEKDLTATNSFYYIFYIKLKYEDITDLDKKLFLNLIEVEGLSPNVFMISDANGSWASSFKTISFTKVKATTDGLNIYEEIVNDGNYLADFQAQNELTIYIAHNSNVETVDGSNSIWTISPYFEISDKVVASEFNEILETRIVNVEEISQKNKIKVDLSISEGAGYVPLFPNLDGVVNSFYPDWYDESIMNWAVTDSNSPQIFTKEIGYTITQSNWFGLFLGIPYNDITDLDKDFTFNFKALEGFGVNDITELDFKILSRVGGWSPSGSPVYLFNSQLSLNEPINLYEEILADGKANTYLGTYLANYQAQNILYVAVTYYNSDATITNATKTQWSIQPEFESQKRVIANEVTNDLKKEILRGEEIIVSKGDSLTAGSVWDTKIGELSGYQVFNGGTGGENVKTISARSGGDVMMVNNITIPADTSTQVLIADRDVDGGIPTYFGNIVTPLLQGGTAHVNPCYIGDIEGTLTWTGADYADTTGDWVFTRTTEGAETVIERPTALRTNLDMNYNQGIQIIFMGQNGGYDDLDDLVLQHRRMIEHGEYRKTIILGLSSGSATTRADYEARMKLEFGRYFISIREYLTTPIYDTDGTTVISCYGIEDSNNLTGTNFVLGTDFTAQDIIDGIVPPCLLSDAVHYTTETKEIIGIMIYKRMRDLNIFKA